MSWQPKTNEWYISQLRKEQNKLRDSFFKQAKGNTQGINFGGLGGKSGSASGTTTFRPTVQIVTKLEDDGTATSYWNRIKANSSVIQVQQAGTNTNGSNRNPSTTEPTVKWVDGIKNDGQILILTPIEGKILTLERYGNIDLASNLTVNDNQFVYLQYYADKKTYDASNNVISNGAFAVMNTATTVSGGASQALDKLTDPTAINQDLLPNYTAGSVDGSSNPIDQNLGSATLVWADAYIKDIYSTGTVRTPTTDHDLHIYTGGGQRLTISDNATSNAGYAELFGVSSSTNEPEFKTVSTDSTPAVGDFVGGYAMDGYNSSVARKTYARLNTKIVSKTNGSEAARVEINVMDGAGNLDPMFEVNNSGILLPTATHATPSTNGSIYRDSSGNIIIRRGGSTKTLSNVNTSSQSLDDLSDVTIGTPSANTVLKWSGSEWVDGNVVDANIDAGANITWSKINKAGSSLDDLADTTIGTPSANTVLKWSGSAWVDGNVVDANIDGTITWAKINKSGSTLDDIGDTLIGSTPSANTVLRYDSTQSKWVDGLIGNDQIASNAAIAGSKINASLDDLSDTTIGTPSANTVLKWSGSAWVDGNVVNVNIDSGANIDWTKINKTGSSLDDLGDTVIGTPSNNTVLKYVSGTGWVDGNVVNNNIDASAGIAQSKMATVTNMRVLGNTSGSSTTPQEITIYDEDNMSSNSATGIATQQSIKAYVASQVGGANTELDNLGTTSINADLIPQSNKDLGTSGNQWTDLWVDGVAYIDAIGFGTTAMTLPTSDGNANYVLKTDGSGTLSWASVSGASTSFVGFSADDDLNMNTRDITNLDRLFFDLTGSDALGASHSGIAADTTGMVFQLPSNDYYTFKIGSGTEFSVSASSVSVSSKRITQLSDPTGDTDALNKQWLCGSSSDIITNTRLGSSPSSSKYLRGDMTWQTVNTSCVGYSGGSNASQSIQLGGYSVEGFGSLSSSSGGGYLKFNGTTKARLNSNGLQMSDDINMNNNDIDNCNYIDSDTIICNSTFTSTASSSQFTGSVTALYSSTTYLGNSGDTIRIGGQLRFDANTSSDSSPPSSTSGKIAIKVGSSTKYVYYYSS